MDITKTWEWNHVHSSEEPLDMITTAKEAAKVSELTVKDIFEEMEEYTPNLLTLFLSDEGLARLDRLCGRVGKLKIEVIEAALKLYEDGLDAVDASMRRGSYMSMSFELKE